MRRDEETKRTMPWQTVPSLIIIGGAFNVVAGLLWGLDRLYYGRVSVVFFLFGVHDVIDGQLKL
jgi:hypothetical protein